MVAIGSRGDVAPLTGLGVRLLQQGHRVTIAAYTPFQSLITDCGLGFREIRSEFEPTAEQSEVSPARSIAKFLAPNGMRAVGQAIIEALRNHPVDVLLLSPFAELAGHPLAEAAGVPAIGVRLQPFSATAAHPPAVLGGWSAGPRGNRAAAHTGAWLIDRTYAAVVAGFRRELGLPAVSARIMRRRRTDDDWPVLHGYSPHVSKAPSDWRAGLSVTGYWWPPLPAGWRPPVELVEFLDAGSAPVFVGFGSLMVNTERAEQLSEIVTEALRLAGVRGVVQAGWAGLSASSDDVLPIGEVPHEWLFPRMAAVAHHCGAGTTAAGLRAGVPTIAIPVAGDQSFWATRLSGIGVCAATVPYRRLTATRLADAIRATVANRELAATTTVMADRLAGEDGVGVAADAITHRAL